MTPRSLLVPVTHRRAAFTLVELMLAMAMTAVVLVAALSGVVTLQRSYAATEQYATGMADEMRLLDYLALDLRRAMTISTSTAPWTMDPDLQGLQINVPDYYHFNDSDPQHLFPVANDPTYDPTSGTAYYNSSGAVANVAGVMPHQTIAYRFTNGSITRTDPWLPLVSNGSGGFVSSGPVTIAYGMDAFPTLTPDPTDSTGGTVRYNISFHSTFQPLATANPTDVITLHNVTFVRSKTSRASALVIVMLMVCVLSVVAGSLLLTTTARYHTTFQSASWQESIVGAEAGVDMAMNELRKRINQGAGAAFATNWTTQSPAGPPYPNYGHAFPASNQAYTLSTHTGEGNSAMQARVYVDVPGSGATPTVNFAIPPDSSTATFISQLDNPNLRDPDGVDRSRWWYRIRALGTAGLSGPPISNLQKLDNQLRRFSFYTDWRTSQPVTSPQVSRLVEITAKPLTNFRNALMADKQINLSNQDVLIDSYDSSKGPYDATNNHGMMGNIATNGQLINANYATVDGDAMTDNGNVKAGDNVTGQQSSNFYQELTPLTPGMLNPAWSSVPSGGTVTASTTYTASTDSTNPALVRLDGINLPSGGNSIEVAAPASASTTTPSFIKIYVQGDIITHTDSFINLDPGVNAIIYFTGNVNLQGNGVFNDSFLASHLVLNGIQPPANTDGSYPARNITISTYQDLEAIVYAPNHDLRLALQAAPASASSSGDGGEDSNATGEVSQQLTKLQQQLAAAVAKGDTKGIAKIQAQINALTGTTTTATTTDHSRGYNGIYGGFVAKTITVANKTHVHYDETLRQAGPVNHYQIVSWFEDNVSRDAVGGTEQFWWPGAAP